MVRAVATASVCDDAACDGEHGRRNSGPIIALCPTLCSRSPYSCDEVAETSRDASQWLLGASHEHSNAASIAELSSLRIGAGELAAALGMSQGDADMDAESQHQ
jgi:hypothetical protein